VCVCEKTDNTAAIVVVWVRRCRWQSRLRCGARREQAHEAKRRGGEELSQGEQGSAIAAPVTERTAALANDQAAIVRTRRHRRQHIETDQVAVHKYRHAEVLVHSDRHVCPLQPELVEERSGNLHLGGVNLDHKLQRTKRAREHVSHEHTRFQNIVRASRRVRTRTSTAMFGEPGVPISVSRSCTTVTASPPKNDRMVCVSTPPAPPVFSSSMSQTPTLKGGRGKGKRSTRP
jgi:hypothetical protein